MLEKVSVASQQVVEQSLGHIDQHPSQSTRDVLRSFCPAEQDKKNKKQTPLRASYQHLHPVLSCHDMA